MSNKMHWFKRVGALLLCDLLITLSAAPAFVAEADDDSPSYADPSLIPTNGIEGWPKVFDKNSDYFCVMDAETGVILSEKHKDTETPPASLTKIVTCLVALENGDLDQEATMTEEAVAYAVSGSSNLYTQVGEVFNLRDMLYGMMLKSANDIATQIGITVGGGSLDTFLSMMNAKAKELGCEHSYFANSCGMPNEEHHSSAYDLALISKEALKNPLFREIVNTKTYTIPPTNMTGDSRTFDNHHKMLVTDEYHYDGIIGGKTGYTDLAGSCLATYAERNGRTAIVIALHCLGMENCLEDTRRLLDYALDDFKNVEIPGIEGTIVSGGMVTIPVDASIEECEVSTFVETTPEGMERTESRYTWHGWDVGSVVSEVMLPVSEATEVGVEEGGEAQTEDSLAAGSAASAGAESGRSGQGSREKSSGPVRIFLIIGGVLLAVVAALVIANFYVRAQRAKKRKERAKRRERSADDEGSDSGGRIRDEDQ